MCGKKKKNPAVAVNMIIRKRQEEKEKQLSRGWRRYSTDVFVYQAEWKCCILKLGASWEQQKGKIWLYISVICHYQQ